MTDWSRHDVQCAECGRALSRRLFRPKDGKRIERFFCDTTCKGVWQRAQKPWSREWLVQKYEVEGLSANAIAEIVGRDAKRVWEWLRGYGIETRPRGHVEALLFKKGHKSEWAGKKHTDATRKKISDARKRDGHYPKTPDGRPYWTGKKGEAHPTWKGGCTPERATIYGSLEWKLACSAVWRRANACCERCKKDHRVIDRAKERFHVHHILPFFIGKRRTDPSNLALLCEGCHRFVHSDKNGNREFLPYFGTFPVNGKLMSISYYPKKKVELPSWLV